MITQSISLQELADLLNAKLEGDPQKILTGVAPLDKAGSSDLSFFTRPAFNAAKYEKALESTEAGCVLIDADYPLPQGGGNFLQVANASQTFQEVIRFLKKETLAPTHFEGIHPTAVIHESAKIGDGAQIGPHVVVDAHVVVGRNCFIGAGSVIGPRVVIGDDCRIHPRVTIERCCTLQDRVIIQSGAVIGSCGYGYVTDEKGVHHKLDQLGDVVIEEDVEVGANTAIDRARFETTRIGRGTKIDNLVQIAHGVELGEHNLIIAQVGIAGSAKTGRNVVMAGQAALIGHAELADEVIVGGAGKVAQSILEPGQYLGTPAIPAKQEIRSRVHWRKLDQHVKTLRKLVKRVEELEKESA